MSDRLIIDIDEAKQTTLAFESAAGAQVESSAPFELAWPLDAPGLAELRWYVEDYSAADVSVSGARVRQVEEKLASWGNALFNAVFGTDEGRDFHRRLPPDWELRTTVVLRSWLPGVLSLPWELLRAPESSRPLSLTARGLIRTIPTAAAMVRSQPIAPPLRLLLVVARPSGERDVAFGNIARPVLNSLDGLGADVEVTLLRPPTIAQLERELVEASNAGRPYHVVHFDCHGALTSAGETHLVLEKPTGGAAPVDTATVAAVLRDGGVQIVVMNACESGTLGGDLEGALSVRLLRSEIASVVAMAYKVGASPAAAFMEAFYEALFGGQPMSAAVTAGRARLADASQRDARVEGGSPADWLVPSNYAVEDLGLIVPRASAKRRSARRASGALSALVGRDDELAAIERAFVHRDVVVLEGAVGVGKSAIAHAFAEWFARTEPGRAIVVDVLPAQLATPDALDRSLAGLGLGGDLAARVAVLLVVDGLDAKARSSDLEAVHKTLRSAVEAALTTAGIETRDATVKVKVLATSRHLSRDGGDVHYEVVDGLRWPDLVHYARAVLQRSSIDLSGQSQRPGLPELLMAAGGNPSVVEAVLPLVAQHDPIVLAEALRRPLQADPSSAAAAQVAAAVRPIVAEVVDGLGRRTRRLAQNLRASGAMTSCAVLARLSDSRHPPAALRNVTPGSWRIVLDELEAAGLAASRGGGLYRLHPALLGHLAASDEVPSDTTDAIAVLGFIDAYSRISADLAAAVEAGSEGALRFVALYELDLEGFLVSSLRGPDPLVAPQLLTGLLNYWESTEQARKIRYWCDAVLDRLDRFDWSPGDELTSLVRTWVFMAMSRSMQALHDRDLDRAETILAGLRERVEGLRSSWLQRYLVAQVRHQLGMLAFFQRRYEAAVAMNEAAVEILRALGPGDGRIHVEGALGNSLQELGIAQHELGRYDEAEASFSEALRIARSIGAERRAASLLHELGLTAAAQGEWDNATRYFQRSFAANRRLGDAASAGRSCIGLAREALTRGHAEIAERWYREAVSLLATTDDLADLGAAYEELANVHRAQGALTLEHDWLLQALELAERLRDNRQILRLYQHLARNLVMRNDWASADKWLSRARQLASGSGESEALTLILYAMAISATEVGDLDRAERLYGESLALRQGPDREAFRATVLHQLSMIADGRGDGDRARELEEESLRIHEGSDDRAAQCVNHFAMGQLLANAGEMVGAQSHYLRAFELARETGELWVVPALATAVAELAERSGGDLGVVEKWLELGVQISERLLDLRSAAGLSVRLARFLSEHDRPRDALTSYVRALRDFHQVGIPVDECAWLASELEGRLGPTAVADEWQRTYGETVPASVAAALADAANVRKPARSDPTNDEDEERVS